MARKSLARRMAVALLCQSGIWLLVGFNYVQHVIMYPISLPAILLGHAILLMQLSSWLQVMVQPLIALPAGWADGGASMVDKKTGETIPLRAHVIRGETILGFDHFCGWLGVPIGLHNRRFFIQFLLYSCIICCFGGYHAYAKTVSGPSSSSPAAGMAGAAERPQWEGVLIIMLSPGIKMLSMVTESFGVEFTLTVDTYTMLADSAVGFGLAVFFAFHVQLVLRNQSTIDRTTHFDVGRAENFAQVFGRRPLAWLLPVWGDGPAVDGVNWPLRIHIGRAC